jgi:protein-tyrosine kinase
MSIIEKAVEQLTKRTVDDLSAGTDPNVEKAPESLVSLSEGERAVVTLGSKEAGGAAKATAAHYADLNFSRLGEEGFQIPGSTSGSSIGQELQLIKRRLLLNAQDLKSRGVEDSNLVLVTSAMPKEGKSFISINLALSMAAELNKKPLLIDADVAKNDVSNVLGLNAELGLTDILANDVNIAQALFECNVPNLKILPAGPQLSNTVELLASDRMVAFLDEIIRDYDDHMIFLDGPPLMATSEASVLARMVGQVVVVVEAGRTTEAQLEEALSRLDPNKTISLILNKSREGQKKGDYGYYYAG